VTGGTAIVILNQLAVDWSRVPEWMLYVYVGILLATVALGLGALGFLFWVLGRKLWRQVFGRPQK
jgi:hypothetical protein